MKRTSRCLDGNREEGGLRKGEKSDCTLGEKEGGKGQGKAIGTKKKCSGGEKRFQHQN